MQMTFIHAFGTPEWLTAFFHESVSELAEAGLQVSATGQIKHL
jgi:hypothetical protein